MYEYALIPNSFTIAQKNPRPWEQARGIAKITKAPVDAGALAATCGTQGLLERGLHRREDGCRDIRRLAVVGGDEER